MLMSGLHTIIMPSEKKEKYLMYDITIFRDLTYTEVPNMYMDVIH